MNKILSLFGIPKKNSSKATVGYCYVPSSSHEPIRNARIGATIENPTDEPPWIVVDKSIDSLVVAKWPGQIWKLEILRPAKQQPNSSANYVRAASVKVLDEVPIAVLFGPNGQGVVDVIESARTLDFQQGMKLASFFKSDALNLYSEAWNRWLNELCRLDESHKRDDYSNTLAITGASKRSPVGTAFTVLFSVLRDRLIEIVGESAFVVDEDGNESFSSDWSIVFNALLCAAMGFGINDILSANEKDCLTKAWRDTFSKAQQ